MYVGLLLCIDYALIGFVVHRAKNTLFRSTFYDISIDVQVLIDEFLNG